MLDRSSGSFDHLIRTTAVPCPAETQSFHRRTEPPAVSKSPYSRDFFLFFLVLISIDLAVARQNHSMLKSRFSIKTTSLFSVSNEYAAAPWKSRIFTRFQTDIALFALA